MDHSNGSYNEVDFKVWEYFPGKNVVKEAIQNLTVYTNRQLRMIKNGGVRIRTRCLGDVPGGRNFGRRSLIPIRRKK